MSHFQRKIKGKSGEIGENNVKKMLAKFFRYFPLKPLLHKLFLSSKIAKNMRWHAININNDEIMRHLRDSEA